MIPFSASPDARVPLFATGSSTGAARSFLSAAEDDDLGLAFADVELVDGQR